MARTWTNSSPCQAAVKRKAEEQLDGDRKRIKQSSTPQPAPLDKIAVKVVTFPEK
ncbi:hypothetical protein LTR16_012645, partial [Cryomyces antarcticus]